MKKKTAVIWLVLFLIVAVGMGYVAFFGIGPTKTGSMSNIKQGLDLAGGVSITYQVVGDETPPRLHRGLHRVGTFVPPTR